MRMPDELVSKALAYFGRVAGRDLSAPADLARLSCGELLQLADRIPDELLPALVGLLKGADPCVFERLLGEHEEENRELSDRFFERYRAVVLDPGEEDSNPLETWLPPEACQDLAFLASRQAFFLRQEIRHVNDWLGRNFGIGPFPAAAQLEAWSALWMRLTRS
jgi:hypothetical protein